MANFIGNKPNQVPTNGDLGSMAFEDSTNYITKNNPAHQSFRNRIINGDMRIAQRGTSVTGMTGGGYHTVDRMYTNIAGAGTWTITQDTDVPTGQGFASSLKYLCTTANASLTGTNQVAVDTRIEGQNLQQLSYGTANAKATTLSFWVKSNKTGTQTLELSSFGGTTRSISKTYTIDTADTWEKKTITIEGDTSGALPNTNALGFVVKWWFAAGPTFTSGTLSTSWTSLLNADRVSSSNMNLADTVSNYINITGVQLEVGTTATDFEHRPYDMELQRCQRYFQICGFHGVAYNTAEMGIASQFKVKMRTQPSMSTVLYNSDNYTGSANTIFRVGVGNTATTSASYNSPSSGNNIGNILTTGLTANNIYFGSFQASAEL